MRANRKRLSIALVGLLVIGLIFVVVLYKPSSSPSSARSPEKTAQLVNQVSQATSTSNAAELSNAEVVSTIDYGSLSDKMPTESLAASVLTPDVRAALGSSIVYNGAGAFVINQNQPSISTTGSKPYAKSTPLSADRQLGRATSILDFTTYQGLTRDKTSSGGKPNSATINPPGWHQMKLSGSPYKDLYNRGHLLGYALIGNLAGFDASEANPDNISTQTAWANQAYGGSQGDGQNYFENIIREAIKNHETLKYEVTPIYSGADLVPSGMEIEAEGVGNAIRFNVFVPNVEPGVAIHYADGTASLQTGQAANSAALSTASKTASTATPAASSVAASQRTVYVASHGTSKAYWYDKSKMPKSTNGAAVVTMTEAEAIAAGKHHSEEEGN